MYLTMIQDTYEMLHIMFAQNPPALRIWVGLLVFLNFVVPLAFWTETDIAATAFVVANIQAVAMSWIYGTYGFVRLMGLAHAGWAVMVPWIYFYRLQEFDSASIVYKWLVSMLVFDTVSVVLDIVDVVKFVSGETAPVAYYKKSTTKKKV